MSISATNHTNAANAYSISYPIQALISDYGGVVSLCV
jgi:hypothetical protein